MRACRCERTEASALAPVHRKQLPRDSDVVRTTAGEQAKNHNRHGRARSGAFVRWAALAGEPDGDLVGLGLNRAALRDDGEAKARRSGFSQCGFQGFGDGVGSFGGQCPVFCGAGFGGVCDHRNVGSCGEGAKSLRSRTNRGFGGFVQRG
jgi:hypothetical protein